MATSTHQPSRPGPDKPRPHGRRRAGRPGRSKELHRPFYIALAAPGIIWLILLFIVPFYTIIAIAAGHVNQVFGYPIAVWNPLQWSSDNFTSAWRDVAGTSAFVGPIIIRTLIYVALSSVLSLVIPIRLPTRRQVRRPPQGTVPRSADRAVLDQLHDAHAGLDRLAAVNGSGTGRSHSSACQGTQHGYSGMPVTVIFGLVYGYIPYLILVLFAGLDRIDPALIEAGRDLGLGRLKTFIRVTLPLSRQAILTGLLITTLPMLGDYFTNQLLSGTTRNHDARQRNRPAAQHARIAGRRRCVSLLFLLVLIAPMIYYVLATNRSSRAAV